MRFTTDVRAEGFAGRAGACKDELEVEAAAVVVWGLMSGADKVPDDRAAYCLVGCYAEGIISLPGHLLVVPPRSQGFGGDCEAIFRQKLSPMQLLWLYPVRDSMLILYTVS